MMFLEGVICEILCNNCNIPLDPIGAAVNIIDRKDQIISASVTSKRFGDHIAILCLKTITPAEILHTFHTMI